jgi:prepilin-type N-terminal cleavage/methylation domain-containing protein
MKRPQQHKKRKEEIAKMTTPIHRRRAERRRTRAFTLIEMIGVLAVVALLAAAIIPAVIKRLDWAAYTAEQNGLTGLTNALLQQVYLNKSVPSSSSATAWAQSAANWLNLPVSEILTNARHNARAYLVDTSGWLGSSDALNGYVQTTNGTAFTPTNARVLIVSSIGKPLPLASGALSPRDFDEIWNTGYLQKPASWNGWSGSGDDLVIQRMTYTPCFNRLILLNHFTTNGAAFTIDPYTTSPVNLSDPSSPSYYIYTTNGWDSYYVAGTSLGLCSNTVLQAKVVLVQDSSYVFENGAWQGTIVTGTVGTNPNTNNPADDFSGIASAFLQSGWLPYNTQNKSFFLNPPAGSTNYIPQGSPQDVLSSMESFMVSYTSWANTTPSFNPVLDHSMGDYLGTVINNGLIQDGGIKGPGILY